MTTIHRRSKHPVKHSQPVPPKKTTGYGATARDVQNTKKFNQDIRVIDGFRYASISQGITPQTLTLTTVGRLILGISILPISGGDISDIAIDFNVNSMQLLTGFNVQNANPNYVQGMIYFPLPQPLHGNDVIKANFNKSNAGTIGLYLNVFYLPQA